MNVKAICLTLVVWCALISQASADDLHVAVTIHREETGAINKLGASYELTYFADDKDAEETKNALRKAKKKGDYLFFRSSDSVAVVSFYTERAKLLPKEGGESREWDNIVMYSGSKKSVNAQREAAKSRGKKPAHLETIDLRTKATAFYSGKLPHLTSVGGKLKTEIGTRLLQYLGDAAKTKFLGLLKKYAAAEAEPDLAIYISRLKANDLFISHLNTVRRLNEQVDRAEKLIKAIQDGAQNDISQTLAETTNDLELAAYESVRTFRALPPETKALAGKIGWNPDIRVSPPISANEEGSSKAMNEQLKRELEKIRIKWATLLESD